MKTKLTLTVHDTIIKRAKRQAKSQGTSVSELFETVFSGGEPQIIKTHAQKAAENLMNRLLKNQAAVITDDKAEIKAYVKRKFA